MQTSRAVRMPGLRDSSSCWHARCGTFACGQTAPDRHVVRCWLAGVSRSKVLATRRRWRHPTRGYPRACKWVGSWKVQWRVGARLGLSEQLHHIAGPTVSLGEEATQVKERLDRCWQAGVLELRPTTVGSTRASVVCARTIAPLVFGGALGLLHHTTLRHPGREELHCHAARLSESDSYHRLAVANFNLDRTDGPWAIKTHHRSRSCTKSPEIKRFRLHLATFCVFGAMRREIAELWR